MIDEHLSIARREALDLLEENGITDEWRPLDGGRGADIIATVDGILERIERDEMPALEDLAQWPELYGEEAAALMRECLDNARTLHLVAAARLAKTLDVLRWGDEGKPTRLAKDRRAAKDRPALDLLTPETRRALVRSFGYGPALKLCEDEKQAALATARAMLTGEPARPFKPSFKTAPPLRRRKHGRKG